MTDDTAPRQPDTDPLDAVVGAAALRCLGGVAWSVFSIVVWLWAGSLGAGTPFTGFVIAVVPLSIGCGIAFGWRAGILATALASAAGLYFILPPRFSFAMLDDAEFLFFSAIVTGTAFASYILGLHAKSK